MKKLIITALALSAMAASAEVPLKIYRGDQRSDTVYSSRQYVVGVTTPGATATIAGDSCHVYRTGTFGSAVDLAPGENMIPVSVCIGNSRTTTDVRLVYIERERHQTAPTVTESLGAPLHLRTLPGAYLQYGNGGDRLGGSKMGYIDSGICLTAVGKTENLYKVALGNNAFAYIPRSTVEEGGSGQPIVNSGSASITSDGKMDCLSISLPERVAYWARTEIDPATIKISLYGVTNNTNWLTQRGSLGMVEFVDFRQEQSDVLTVVLRLKEKYSWGFSVGYKDNTLTVGVRHRPASLALSDLTIGVDAGHGGAFPGAWSPSGLSEKEVNLDIAKEVARLLRQAGAQVVMTREGDTGPSMTERKQTWLRGNVDLAVSIHNNSSGNPLASLGTSSYYKHISNRALASCLHESMLSLGLADFGLTGNFNFSLNSPTEYPNALVEVLFMSSLAEDELLADPDYRKQLAAKIFQGIADYLELVARD